MRFLSLATMIAGCTLTGLQANAQDGGVTEPWSVPLHPCPPEDVTINISTGIDNFGVLASPGSPEVNWICPSTVSNVVGPFAGWGSFSGSRWIANMNGLQGTHNYTFTRNFATAGPGTIVFKALADNRVDIYLDGILKAWTPGTSIMGFVPGMEAMTGPNPIGTGNHTLVAVVKDVNTGAGATGFNLEGQVVYTASDIDISTGVGQLPGNKDANWKELTYGYDTIVVPHSAWDDFVDSTPIPDTLKSRWLSRPFTDQATEHINQVAPISAAYHYTRALPVPPGGGLLVFEAMADNKMEIYLDGVTTPIAAQMVNDTGYRLVNKVSYTSIISAGPHTLHVNVHNSGVVEGFNLHGKLYICGGGNPIGGGDEGYGKPGKSKTSITDAGLSIKPNPNNGTFTLFGKSGMGSGKDAEVEISDMLGKTVYKNKFSLANGMINASIELGKDVPNGVYFVRMVNDKAFNTLRFIVNR